MEEVHYGGEGPHWTVLSMKKKKKNLVIWLEAHREGYTVSRISEPGIR